MTDSASKPVVAIDAMGGDHGAVVTVPAALQVLQEYATQKLSGLSLILVGDSSVLQPAIDRELNNYPLVSKDQIEVQHASEKVEMDEAPAQALRKKKDSSMRVAINQVKEGRAGAAVSAGNTGALMAISRFVLKMLPGVDRPAICSAMPAINGFSYMLDLGANVDTTPEHLLQFAVMGSELVSAITENSNPTVGLLNIGEEDIKGNEIVKDTAELLTKSDLNYYGYVEGDDIFKGTVDLIVCDGFVGNVALKSAEGVANMVSHFMRAEFGRNWLTKLVGLLAMPILRALKGHFDPDKYNGASLLGLRGIVVKSHGGAKVEGVVSAIKVAITEIEHSVPDKISEHVKGALVS